MAAAAADFQIVALPGDASQLLVADPPPLPPLPEEDGQWVFAKASWFSRRSIKTRPPTMAMIEKQMTVRARLRSTGQWGKLAQDSSELMARYPLLALAVASHEFHIKRRRDWAAAKRSQRQLQRLHPVPVRDPVPAGPLPLEDGADAAELDGEEDLPLAESDVSSDDGEYLELVHLLEEELAAENRALNMEVDVDSTSTSSEALQ
jgi:hypothetical protein